MKKRVTVKSSYYVILIVALLLSLAIGKLFFVALSSKVDGVNLREFAENRNTKTNILYASRGSIYDNDNNILATSSNSYKLIAYLSPTRTTDSSNPKHVVDKVGTAKALAPILDMDESKILEYLNKQAYQVEFGSKGKNLTEITKKKIEDLELPGLDFIESTQRYYKMGNFASYIVGYAKSTDEGDIVGELGIESYFNDTLSGKDGYEIYQSDAYGYQLPSIPAVTEEATAGNDIHLTIDSNIQLILENAMNDLKTNYKMDWAIMTVMDAKTGAIVGTSTNPSFNPNNLNTLESYLNPLVSYAYEPGSTMKIFSWASAIEEGIYDGSKEYKSGSIKVADVTISDFNKEGWGKISYDTGFAYSSNVAAVLLSKELGKQKLYDYYDRFGFGKKTGIELSGEAEGDIEFVYDSELATASFGQGITVTPVQLLQAISAVANDGYMITPYLVDSITSPDGSTVYKHEINKTEVMKKSTTDKLRELMYNVNYNGLSKVWRPKLVNMIIKTGTAQIASPKGGYLSGEYDKIMSLAGIFPDNDPKYIIYVATKQLEASQSTLAKTVTKVVDEISSYANLTNEQTLYDDKIITLEDYKSLKCEDVKKELESKGLKVYTLGSGDYIISQYPDNLSKVISGTKVFLKTNKNDYTMPDITNWSTSEVQTFAKLTGLTLNTTGYGYVKEQSIPKGSSINSGDTLNVTLN